MQKFSLSTIKNALPDAVTVDGSAFPIYTDFRRILRILRLLNDPEVLDGDKHILFLKLFFKGQIPPEPQDVFLWFLHMGEEHEGGGERDFDYEQDAKEIYSGFQQVYGIDLLETDMHFWRFSALLSGLFCTDTALANKVQLRHADDGKAKQKANLARAKRNAAINQNISKGDAAIEQKIRERLKAGKSIGDLIGGDAHA